MNKEFIPYEQALELKELGFDYSSMFYWNEGHNGYHITDGRYDYTNTHWMFTADDGKNRDKMCVAPLYQQAFRWFREKYGYIGGIRKLGTSGNNIILGEFYKDDDNYFMMFGETYEDCELKSLKKLIEIAKNK